MVGRFQNAASRAGELASFIRPEILAISAAKLKKLLAAKQLAPYRLMLERLVRYKPHTLTKGEEKLLAMQSEMAGAAGHAFRQLTDADLTFGTVKNEAGEELELSQATFSVFLHSPKRAVRKKAFHQFYEQFAAHENTLAATLKGSIQGDVYYAKARSYASARESSLFSDDVPVSVYDNLVSAVRGKLPAVYKYLDVRRRAMKLKELHHYDTYVPILSDLDVRHTWDQAVKKVVASLQPLGKEYCGVLEKGLKGRWCDRYPNKGKQSGAFSCGTFDADPYILMNYQPEVLDPRLHADARGGALDAQLLLGEEPAIRVLQLHDLRRRGGQHVQRAIAQPHMMDRAKSDQERAYLINREIDAIRGTIIRQTMFAEFEKITHELAEIGEPLTVDRFKKVYRELLDAYFGPQSESGFVIDDELELECFRIPHFYRAFYVYKYATGLSAAIALSQRVLNGGKEELSDYLSFLKGGCSKYPLELLRDAGVNMESPAPVETALDYFAGLVDELDALL